MKFPLFLAPLLRLFIALSRFVTLFTPRCLLLEPRATPHLVGISSTEKPHVAKQIIRDHDQIVNNQPGQFNISLVKDRLIQRYQSFDERAYGYLTFTNFFRNNFGEKYHIEAGKTGCYVWKK